MAYLCPICGKAKSSGNHRKCSRILQRMYAPGTKLHAERAAEEAGRKAMPPERPSRRHLSLYARCGLLKAEE